MCKTWAKRLVILRWSKGRLDEGRGTTLGEWLRYELTSCYIAASLRLVEMELVDDAYRHGASTDSPGVQCGFRTP